MTRREREILIASVSWTDKSLTVNEEKAFQAGARWADKTMIDKVCKWITENIFDFPWYDSESELSSKDIAEEIRKALEE